MSSLAIFQFEGQDVRFVGGKPVANDVAAVLGYKDPADAIWRKVKSKNKGLCILQTPGGKQDVMVLEEAGVYQLIFGSKLPSAERFQDWVFDEVLPSIRKTGSYSIANLEPKRAITYYSDRVMHLKAHLKVPNGYWCCIQECGHLLLDVERMGYQVNEFDLLDGSIGTRWGNYRKGKPWAQPSKKASYRMPGKFFPVKINAYVLPEIVHFKQWLPTYEENNLMKYLVGKYGTLVKVD